MEFCALLVVLGPIGFAVALIAHAAAFWLSAPKPPTARILEAPR
jgi:hypothetical protein